MLIEIPQHHNFPSILAEKIFKQTECSLPNWEISVQKENDVAWSIVLAYLISTYYKKPKIKRDKQRINRNQERIKRKKQSIKREKQKLGERNLWFPDDFVRRLKNLTGRDENLQKVKKSIWFFNPFRNRYSCFYDDTLKNLIEDFKSNLRWESLHTVSDKLMATSKLLCCRILLIWTDKGTEISQIYSENIESSTDLISLYARDIESEGTVHNFLLDYQVGLKMKAEALKYYLKEAEVPPTIIKEIEMLNRREENFLISLLSSDCRNVILTLYKSTYIIEKLAEAGYKIDPRLKDSNGLSVLYHALVCGDEKILYELYSFAANNCFQSPDYSYRNPDCSIVNNLNCLQEILTTDIDKSDFKNHPNYERLKLAADDLLKVNKFLFELNSKILEIKTREKDNDSDETVFEACKRRDIIVSILDTYQKFFKRLENDDLNISLVEDYLKFMAYYNFIDVATAVIFFDNIIYLKERLALKDGNQFSVIESSFFLLVSNHVVIKELNITESCENVPHFMQRDMNPFIPRKVNTLHISPLIRRLDNIDKVREFSKILHDTIISKECVVRGIPEKVILNVFNSYPIFKECLLMKRLINYLKTAVNIRVHDVKSVLVIERVLQVIGEHISPEDDNDHSFRRLLQLILPKDVFRILRRTRDNLSHLKNKYNTFKARAECETKFSLFRSIQGEISAIQRQFNPIFDIYLLRELLYFVNVYKEHLDEIRNSPNLYASFLQPFSLSENSLRIEDLLLGSINNFFHQELSLSCDGIFKIVFCNVEKEIADEIDWTKSCENIRKRVLNVLWPLKKLIELKIQCEKDNFKTGLDKFKIVENFNPSSDPVSELKDKTNDFLITCKDLFSSLNLPRQKRKRKPLKCIENIERFLKILKGFTNLSDEEKDEIRKEIPEKIKQDIHTKQKLIQSIREGFSISLQNRSSEYEISYLSNKKKEKFLKLYRGGNSEALAVLESPDPIDVLENAFLDNSINKKKYDDLCCKMEFSDKTKKTLGRLVAGQRQKIPSNNLSNLLNRIQLMRKIVIEENEEICNLWIKRQTSSQILTDKIVWLYLRNPPFSSAVEMLLFDCMNIYKEEKRLENPFIKSSKLYSGINLRNVISHGNPLLEALCKLLDPADLPSDLIKKMIRLIENEDAIEAILELYRLLDEDYPKLLSTITNGEKDKYYDLKSRILKCDEWKSCALFLPYNRKTNP